MVINKRDRFVLYLVGAMGADLCSFKMIFCHMVKFNLFGLSPQVFPTVAIESEVNIFVCLFFQLVHGKASENKYILKKQE